MMNKLLNIFKQQLTKVNIIFALYLLFTIFVLAQLTYLLINPKL